MFELFIAAAFYLAGACSNGASCEVKSVTPDPFPGVTRNYNL